MESQKFSEDTSVQNNCQEGNLTSANNTKNKRDLLLRFCKSSFLLLIPHDIYSYLPSNTKGGYAEVRKNSFQSPYNVEALPVQNGFISANSEPANRRQSRDP